MSDKKITVSPGISGMLFIVFLILKLTKTIDWSWWWIFAPIWIPWGLFIIIVVIIAIFSKDY